MVPFTTIRTECILCNIEIFIQLAIILAYVTISGRVHSWSLVYQFKNTSLNITLKKTVYDNRV